LRVVITGHVGLLTAATLAAIVDDVVGVDEDEEKIDRPEQGMSPLLRTRTPVHLRRHARQPPVRRTWTPSSDPRPTDQQTTDWPREVWRD
jgi:UDP-glucose 6-dehydrogenase